MGKEQHDEEQREKMVDWLRKYIASGAMPTSSIIAKALGLSDGQVSSRLKTLAKQRRIAYTPGDYSTLRVLEGRVGAGKAHKANGVLHAVPSEPTTGPALGGGRLLESSLHVLLRAIAHDIGLERAIEILEEERYVRALLARGLGAAPQAPLV